jgi:hypothetical protein
MRHFVGDSVGCVDWIDRGVGHPCDLVDRDCSDDEVGERRHPWLAEPEDQAPRGAWYASANAMTS